MVTPPPTPWMSDHPTSKGRTSRMNISSFALRRGALITLILVFASGLAACSGGSDASEPADGGTGGTATVEDGAVEITAEQSSSSTSAPSRRRLARTSRSPSSTTTRRRTTSASTPRRVAICWARSARPPRPARPSRSTWARSSRATYYFQCDIHPDMNGTVVVERLSHPSRPMTGGAKAPLLLCRRSRTSAAQRRLSRTRARLRQALAGPSGSSVRLAADSANEDAVSALPGSSGCRGFRSLSGGFNQPTRAARRRSRPFEPDPAARSPRGGRSPTRR